MTEHNPQIDTEDDGVRRFTGRHAAYIICSFFGVVIIVNLIMAGSALFTFGGTIVDNSYVASQKYNGWIEQGEEQAKLGWVIANIAHDGDKVTIAMHDKTGEPLEDMVISVMAEHPLGQKDAVDLVLSETQQNGIYKSDMPLEKGRWKLKITAKKGADSARYVREIGGK